MSILPEFSEHNFSQPPCLTSSESESWYAIHTRSRHEKTVAGQLAQKQIATYLPLTKAIHRWSDRRKLVEEPLFGGYVFVRVPLSGEIRMSVLRTVGVVAFVGIQGRALPIPDKQIEDVKTLLASRIPFGEFPFLRLGQRVRIRGGCLDGIEGILVAENADRSVVVSIELIQRALEIRVSGFDLEVI
jgi:transcription termination/antitermination protein NusG